MTTDPAWRSAPSHIARADLIAGQAEDRRRFDPAVLLPGSTPARWDAVVVAAAPIAALVDYDAPPVRRVAELVPSSVTEPRPGVYVVDFGQNINGWTRLVEPRTGRHGDHPHPRRVAGCPTAT